MPPHRFESDEERDGELAQRVRMGDHAAYAELFRAYYGPLAGFANSLVSAPDVAEEITQNVLHRFWGYRERDGFPPRSISNYLFGAVRKEAVTHLRHRRVVERTEELVLSTDADARAGAGIPLIEDVDAPTRFHELVDAVRAAIDELPPRSRQAFLLCRQHGMTYGEIAKVMGISRNTVENHMGTALRILRVRLAAFL